MSEIKVEDVDSVDISGPAEPGAIEPANKKQTTTEAPLLPEQDKATAEEDFSSSPGLGEESMDGKSSPPPTEEEVVSAIEEAEDKINDFVLNSTARRSSRRLYYGGPGKPGKHEKPMPSWASINTSQDFEFLEGEDGDGEKPAVENNNNTYGDFLASRGNIQALKSDVNEAEKLFYEKNFPKGSAESKDTPRFKLQSFNRAVYDDIEHTWEKKAFTVDYMPMFFGTVREDKMEKLIKSKRSKIAKSGSWDPEGLVLSDIGKPFRCKLHFSVNDEKNLPRNFKIEYLSGLWFSKVYSGDGGKFSEWVEDAIKCVRAKYNKKVSAHRNFYAYYPSHGKNLLPDETLVVFFVKIRK